jgi:peptidoglycan/xylan/chitin deacetylase (PgdA/CDA1 family)
VERAWPQLQERGWPATLFVVSDFIGTTRRFPWDQDAGVDDETARLMTMTQLTEAHESGLDIGSHSSNHPWLPALSRAELMSELVASRADIEDHLGTPVRSFAYPTGGWDDVVRDATEEAGYEWAITVDRGLNTAGHDPLALRRAFVPHDLRDLRLILDGAYTWLRPLDNYRGRREPVQ